PPAPSRRRRRRSNRPSRGHPFALKWHGGNRASPPRLEDLLLPLGNHGETSNGAHPRRLQRDEGRRSGPGEKILEPPCAAVDENRPPNALVCRPCRAGAHDGQPPSAPAVGWAALEASRRRPLQEVPDVLAANVASSLDPAWVRR